MGGQLALIEEMPTESRIVAGVLIGGAAGVGINKLTGKKISHKKAGLSGATIVGVAGYAGPEAIESFRNWLIKRYSENKVAANVMGGLLGSASIFYLLRKSRKKLLNRKKTLNKDLASSKTLDRPISSISK